MTRVTTAIVAPEATQAAPAAPEALAATVIDMTMQPRTVLLSGMTYNVFPQSVVLARLGYVFDPSMPPMVYADSQMTIMQMMLGTPDEFAVRNANEAITDAVAAEERNFAQAVADAAAQMIRDREQAERKAAMAVKVAEAEANLKALKAAAEATV
jgi:hypothetical protein